MQKYFFIVVAASVSITGCATIKPVAVPTPAVKVIQDSRVGVESVASQNAGGQILIPATDQQVITLDSKPDVISANILKREVTRITESPKQGCLKCDIEQVWKDYCDGKILTPKRMKILNENEMPESLNNSHRSCDPSWQGEK